MIGLTAKQAQLLDYLTECERDGECPSFEEMKEAVGLASKSGIHRLLEALEEKGRIRRLKNRARAIEVIHDERAALIASLTRDEVVSAMTRFGFRFVPATA